MAASAWHAVILAASRGADDPMAKATGVAHKCALPVAGVPMLRRVVEALDKSGLAGPIAVSIDNAEAARGAVGATLHRIKILAPKNSAPASARAAIADVGRFPVLVTTGDHALLTREMVEYVITKSEESGADVLAAIATSEVITAAYPETKRTYFNLGGTRVSGCNLFAVMNANGLKLVELWETIERDRKRPWKLVSHFGVKPLVYYLCGWLTPHVAFRLISEKLGIRVMAVFMPFAEAAIDVDKPSDLDLAERILLERELKGATQSLRDSSPSKAGGA
jgi:GTP:adenosylcobinamide-phosphate guanylyltransferase